MARHPQVLNSIEGLDRDVLFPRYCFVLALEPLAIAIRDDDKIHCVTIAKEVHNMSLYADNIILFLTQPQLSINRLFTIIVFFFLFQI